MKHGNININLKIQEFESLEYNKATIDESLLESYVASGHNKEQMILYNYFEPNPMPRVVNDIKNYFNFLQPVSVAVNLAKPGQYLPMHNDFYKKWMQVHSINNISSIYRAIVMLEDSVPGQILQIENTLINSWKQGDYYSWTGSTEHAIYNFSKKNRYAVQVTGYLHEVL